MSRAFVKEQDTEAVEELPDRPVSEHPNDVTPEGAAQIDGQPLSQAGRRLGLGVT